MERFEVKPFTDENAFYFGQCLKAGSNIEISDDLIKYICSLCDNIPYYIDIMFDQIKPYDQITRAEIDNAFNGIIENPEHDKNSLQYNFDRIDKFYPKPEVSKTILNIISKDDQWFEEGKIANEVMQFVEITRLDLNKELKRLKNDGYLLEKYEKGKRYFKFKYGIMRKWWFKNIAY